MPVKQLLRDSILVRPHAPESVSPGGVILTEASQIIPLRGKVTHVGPGKYEYGHHVPMTVKVGDTIIYSKYAMNEVFIDGEKLIEMTESDGVKLILEDD